MKWLDYIPWSVVIVASLFLGTAPFGAQPHLVEKWQMLMAGTLSRPIDIFDLLMHATPITLLLLKIARSFGAKGRLQGELSVGRRNRDSGSDGDADSGGDGD